MSFEFCGCHIETKNFNICKSNKKVPNTWVLLDNQSTVDVFYNKDLLNNIREVETQMNIHCNAGVSTTNLVGDLPGYGTVCRENETRKVMFQNSKFETKDSEIENDNSKFETEEWTEFATNVQSQFIKTNKPKDLN